MLRNEQELKREHASANIIVMSDVFDETWCTGSINIVCMLVVETILIRYFSILNLCKTYRDHTPEEHFFRLSSV